MRKQRKCGNYLFFCEIENNHFDFCCKYIWFSSHSTSHIIIIWHFCSLVPAVKDAKTSTTKTSVGVAPANNKITKVGVANHNGNPQNNRINSEKTPREGKCPSVFSIPWRL